MEADKGFLFLQLDKNDSDPVLDTSPFLAHRICDNCSVILSPDPSIGPETVSCSQRPHFLTRSFRRRNTWHSKLWHRLRTSSSAESLYDHSGRSSTARYPSATADRSSTWSRADSRKTLLKNRCHRIPRPDPHQSIRSRSFLRQPPTTIFSRTDRNGILQ